MHRHASLNRIFRLVWSHVHQAWVAVAETSRGNGKRASRKLLLAAAALAAAQLAQAGPTGGQVTNGSGAITQSGAATTINQTSQKVALQWNSFNTSAAETVNFVQPSKSAIAVNRILDNNATQFFGKLNANGQVWLINPNGVLFGAGSQVNVGGLVASTLDIDDQSVGSAARRFSGAGTGSIVNQGAITAADGGYVAFIGNRVGNQGTITAPGGRVALGAGSDVTLSFAGDSLLGMQVNQGTLDNLADNGGLIRADGGAVILSAGAKDAVLASVVNNTGIIEARSVREVGGAIVLDGGQNSTVSNSGTLDASGRNAGEPGGTVKVLGQDVNLAASSRIDVTGSTGGGSAYIGGNFLGAGPERNAQNTTVAAGSTVLADATGAGNGGQVAVWSDGTTQFDGQISARGGAVSGNGGNVETSGKTLHIGKTAAVNTLAPHGVTGEWLLDPQDLTIGGFDGIDGDITGGQISQALNSSNVTIKTGPAVACTGLPSCSAGNAGAGDIIILDGAWIGGYYDQGVGTLWTAPTTLTLSAYNNIKMVGYSTLDWAGPGTINLRADNTARGIGTVILGDMSTIYGDGQGTLNIFYNPTSYATPTNYATQRTVDNEYQVINNTILNTYMLVNVAATVANKGYDGTTSATLSGAPAVRGGPLPSGVTIDTSGAVASFVDKNVGSNKATVISGITLGGVDAGKYALNGLDASTATIDKANLAVTGIAANNKTYNGTSAATLSGTAAVTAFGADTVSVAGSGVGTFADKNAGVGKAVTVSGFTLAGLDAGNYNLIQPVGLTATIGKANLAVSGLSALNKTYDGTAAATLNGTAAVTAFGSDVVNVSGTGAGVFADKNAGVNKGVTVTGYTLSGTDAGNYNVMQPTGLTATISKANLAVSGIAAFDKTYDATTAATLSGTATVAAIGADIVTVSGSGTGTFASKNAGAGKTVTVSGYTLGGTDAGNYNLVQPSGLTASIAKANLALTGVTANNKTYDGTLAATLSGTASVTALGADAVNVTGSGTAAFGNRNAGLGKAVTVGGYTLAGLDAGNYSLVLPAGLTADIARANLAVTGVTASNKTYDATTAATLAGNATVAAFGSDVVNVAGSGTGVFANKDAGAGKAVTVTGFSLTGSDAANYDIVQPAGLTASIGKANLAVQGVSASDKIYDATTAASLSGSASVAALGADVVTVNGAGNAAFADKNAGTGKTVLVSGYTLGGADAGNYTLAQPSGLTANIGKASLALSGVTADNKTYDSTAAATLAGTASVTAIGADVVGVTGTGSGAFADKNAGLGKVVTVDGFALTGLDAGNYNLVLPTGLTADIARASLAVSGVTASNKTYDATTAATLAGNATVAAFGSDVVNVAGSGTGVFVDKNAGAGKAVTVTGFSLTGSDAANYDIIQPAGLTASIAKANLAVQGVAASDKIYDATTAASLSGSASVAALGADVVTVNGAGNAAFADKNAGAGKTVLVSGYTLGGADAGNYTLAQPSGLTANIGKASLALTGLTASSKTYDSSTAATLGGTASVAAIGSDVVGVTGAGTGAFADKNAGAGKLVTVGGFALTGLDAGNYDLVLPTDLTANISRAYLAVSGVTARDKTYDGTTAASLDGNASVVALGSDSVIVAGTGTGVFTDKNAGASKAVTVTGYTLAGQDAANYTVVQPAELSATINRAGLTISGLAAGDKVYDGTVAASLAGATTVAAFGADAVGVAGTGSAVFADKNAGAGKTVVVTGYTLSGIDAGNYTLAQPAGLTASIAKAGLVLSGVKASNKVYDGTTAATIGGSAAVTGIEGDVVSVTGSGTGTFADKNAGAGKVVTAGGFTLAGADARNYTLLQPENLRADIAKADLVVSGVTASNKVYDGTTAATLGAGATVAAFGADSVSLTGGTGVFADKNAGAGKSVTVSGFTLGGQDAGNYNVVQPAGVRADIGKAQLAVTGITAVDKVYDGTVAASLAGTATVSPFGSDTVALTGTGVATFADKNAGAGKLVAISGYTLAGADAGNYAVVAPATLRAAITPARLVVSGITAADKPFDGTTAATVSTAGLSLAGRIGADSVAVMSTGAFADAAAGAGKTVNLTNTYSGADAANYAIVDQATAQASIAALPQPVVTPVTVEVREAVAQVQSTILAPQASTQPQALTLASTVNEIGTGSSNSSSGSGEPAAADEKTPAKAAGSLINTRFGAGPNAPTLQIQDGGVQLPPLASINNAQ